MHSCRFIIIVSAVALAMARPASAQPLTFARADVRSLDGARSIAAADFDRDGWLDVAQANGSRDSVSILLNNHGVLAHVRDVAVGDGPFDIVAADFNRDTIADLAVANADGNSISLLTGRGDGTFTSGVVDILGQRNPRGLAAADLNRDGWIDLIYTAYISNTINVAWGGPAGFTGSTTSIGGFAEKPQGVAVGDFNHDPFPDLAVAHESSGTVAVLFGDDHGGFVARRLSGAGPMNVLVVADLDGDGWDDIAAVASNADQVALYRGFAGGPSFTGTFATGKSPREILAADLNVDGRLDLITVDRNGNNVSVFLGRTTPTPFTPRMSFTAGAGSRAAAIADFDHDGLPDIATGNEYATSASLLTNTTSFEPAAFVFSSRTIGTEGGIFGGGNTVGAADFDQDGKLDLATYAQSWQAVLVFWGRGGTVALDVPGNLRTFWVADVNRDGFEDVTALFGGFPYSARTFLGDGRGAFAMVPAATDLRATGYQFGDVTGDNVPDLVYASFAAAGGFYAITTAPGDGHGVFRTFVSSSSATAGELRVAALADVDRDGRVDALVFRLNADAAEVWLGDGRGRFAFSESLDASGFSGLQDIAVADVDHNGFPDVVISGGDGASVYLGSASGLRFGGIIIPPGSRDGGGSLLLADINVDGHLDLVYTSQIMVLGNGDGTFRAPDRWALEGSDGTIVDYTGDGLPDVLYARGFGSIGVFVNQRNATNRPPTVTAGPDMSIRYSDQFSGEEPIGRPAGGSDPDLHGLTYVWREDGQVVSTSQRFDLFSPPRLPGAYHFTVTASDGRGGSATDAVTITVLPEKEIVVHAGDGEIRGWESIADPAAAQGVRLHDPNRGAAKVNTPVASPSRFLAIPFVADPTQTYKLWVRLKADGNAYANDSVWLQISGAIDTGGRAYAPGSTSGLAVNLEECSGCGIAGWGWEDDGWGAPNRNGVRLRFPEGGLQRVVIQTREDGVSIDEVVLSAEKYVEMRPGAAKNDATILPVTFRLD